MFSDRFNELCKEKGVSPNKACAEMGLSRSLAAKWKATKTQKPSAEVLEKMSVYFNMSIDEILGNANYQKEKTTETDGLNAKDKRDISKKLEETLSLLENSTDALMFDGEPLDDETRELLRASLQNQLEMTKRLAKQKFTPKKYRK